MAQKIAKNWHQILNVSYCVKACEKFQHLWKEKVQDPTKRKPPFKRVRRQSCGVLIIWDYLYIYAEKDLGWCSIRALSLTHDTN